MGEVEIEEISNGIDDNDDLNNKIKDYGGDTEFSGQKKNDQNDGKEHRMHSGRDSQNDIDDNYDDDHGDDDNNNDDVYDDNNNDDDYDDDDYAGQKKKNKNENKKKKKKKNDDDYDDDDYDFEIDFNYDDNNDEYGIDDDNYYYGGDDDGDEASLEKNKNGFGGDTEFAGQKKKNKNENKKKKEGAKGKAERLGGKKGIDYAIYLRKDIEKCLQPTKMAKGATFRMKQCILRGSQLYNTDKDGIVHSKSKNLCVKGLLGKPLRLMACPNPKSKQ